jgi:hypothetical protein
VSQPDSSVPGGGAIGEADMRCRGNVKAGPYQNQTTKSRSLHRRNASTKMKNPGDQPLASESLGYPSIIGGGVR